MNETVIQQVQREHGERAEFGLKKYKTTMDRQDLTTKEWMKHFKDEVMDATVYITKLMRVMDKLEAKYPGINKLIEEEMDRE